MDDLFRVPVVAIHGMVICNDGTAWALRYGKPNKERPFDDPAMEWYEAAPPIPGSEAYMGRVPYTELDEDEEGELPL